MDSIWILMVLATVSSLHITFPTWVWIVVSILLVFEIIGAISNRR